MTRNSAETSTDLREFGLNMEQSGFVSGQFGIREKSECYNNSTLLSHHAEDK